MGQAARDRSLERGPRAGLWRRVAARAPIYWRDIRDRPAWLFMFAFGRILALRSLHGGLARRRSRPFRDSPSHVVSAPPAATVVERLRKDGLCPGLKISAETCQQILSFAERSPCYAAMDYGAPFLAADHAAAERRYGGRSSWAISSKTSSDARRSWTWLEMPGFGRWRKPIWGEALA